MVKLSAPWIKFVNELTALFREDPDVRVEYNEEEQKVRIFVDKAVKANALSMLIPMEKDFGDVVLKIDVVPANIPDSVGDLLMKAFMGNPVLKEVQNLDTPIGRFSYAVFRKEVVQFYNDDLSDPNGNCSTLYQEIAKDVFGGIGILFCTSEE